MPSVRRGFSIGPSGAAEASPLQAGESRQRRRALRETATGQSRLRRHGGLKACAAGIGVAREGVVVDRQRVGAQLVQERDHPLVRHVFAHVEALLVHHVGERPAHALFRGHRRISERHDQHQPQEVRHAQDALERLLDVDGDMLAAEPERCRRQMHQHGALDRPSVRCDWSRPKVCAPCTVAHCRRPSPVITMRTGASDQPTWVRLALHRLLMGHLIGRMAQLEIALLLHPVDELLVLLGIGAEQLLLDRRILDHDEVPGLAVGARHGPAPASRTLMTYASGIGSPLSLRTLVRVRISSISIRSRRRASRRDQYRSGSCGCSSRLRRIPRAKRWHPAARPRWTKAPSE